MNFIANNWPVIIALAALLGAGVSYIVHMLRNKEITKVQEWLLWAVTNAEKELGSGTGRLKLRSVYDLFVTRFPWVARFLSFEQFSDLVDDALEDMRKMLENNEAVQSFVSGPTE